MILEYNKFREEELGDQLDIIRKSFDAKVGKNGFKQMCKSVIEKYDESFPKITIQIVLYLLNQLKYV